MAELNVVIFDLHWTLIRSTIDFQKMKRRLIDVCVTYGVDRARLSERMKNHVIIRLSRNMLEAKGAPKADIAAMTTHLTDVMNQVELEHVAKTTPINHALDALQWLRRRTVKVGVITRSCRVYAETALRVVGMTDLVDALLARDDVDHPKPDPRHLLAIIDTLDYTPLSAILVGDSTLDAACAQQAGVRFIGVLTGVTNEQQFSAYPCYAVLPSITSLVPILQRCTRCD
jgi:phosphoglycolate phosphatase-like HAD superfamily hydrolase